MEKEDTGSGKQEYKSMYSILYMFLVILTGFSEEGNVKMKIKRTKLLPHLLPSCYIPPCNEWIGELLGAYYLLLLLLGAESVYHLIPC